MTTGEGAPAGMRRAAARTELVAVPMGEGAARVGGATVTWRERHVTCDCPMGGAPICLHRLVARGEERTRDLGEREGTAEVPAVVFPEPSAPEPLPAEDAARFAPILAEVNTLVAELVTLGLRRAARVSGDRARELSARAAAMRPRARGPRDAGLGRLARALERLAALLPALEGPDVGAAEADALRELAITRNLVRALRANTGALSLEDIAGASQRAYVEVPPIEVQGLGLEAWVAAGGVAGVTAYVAVLGERRVLARTRITKGRPERLAEPRTWAEGLAAGPAFARSGVTMRDFARGRFALSGARIALSHGRLSGSRTTSVAPRPALPKGDARLASHVLARAGDAARLGRSLLFDALGRPPRSSPIVLLPVQGLSPSDFDHATQELSLRLRIGAGVELRTSLSFREERSLLFDNLEVLSRAARPPRWLCVRLAREGGALVIEPISAELADGSTIDLGIDVVDPALEVTR